MNPILFVDNDSLLHDNPMSTCYQLKCNRIKNDPAFHYYNIADKLPINYQEYQIIVFGCRSLYLYKPYKGKTKIDIMEKNSELCKIPKKYFIIQDMHPKTYGSIEKLCAFLKDNDINIIFTFYHNAEANSIRMKVPDVKYLHLPHHIDTSIFRCLNLEKKYDILLYGSIHPKHYPFRKRLFELILNHQNIFHVYYVPKPEKFDPEICEGGLARMINLSKICVATKSRYDYLVGKYFEISMGKTLIAGDIPTDGMSIFKNRIVELNPKMTDEEIINILKMALDNYEQYHEAREQLHNDVSQNYSLEIYTKKLQTLVKPGKPSSGGQSEAGLNPLPE